MQEAYRLNDYQHLMRHFSESAPYNAVHFIKLTNDFDRSTLHKAINDTLKRIGLGSPLFFDAGHAVQFDTTSTLESLPLIESSLVAHASREINTPFSDKGLPVRFFVVNDGEGTHLSITYHHWLADGGSIFRLLIQVLQAVNDTPHSSLRLYAPEFQRCFPALKRFNSLSRLEVLYRNSLAFAQAYRPKLTIDAPHPKTLLHFHLFGNQLLPKLKQICHHHQISVNDIFVALLSRVMGVLSHQSRQKVKRKAFKPKRDSILISVIADIRAYSSTDLSDCMNLLLGGYSLAFTSPESKTFDELLTYTHQKTQAIKKSHLPVKSTLTMRFLLKQWAKYRNKFKLFHQKMPITVGISNMNLGHPTKDLSATHYFRFSPSSAMCPLVFSFTHFNGCLSLSIAATDNRYTQSDLTLLSQQFNHELDHLLEECVGASIPA